MLEKTAKSIKQWAHIDYTKTSCFVLKGIRPTLHRTSDERLKMRFRKFNKGNEKKVQWKQQPMEGKGKQLAANLC